MNNGGAKNLTSAILVFFLLLFLYSKFGPKIPISIVSQERGQPLIVEGTGKVAAVPDIAKVSLGIEESGQSLPAVQKSANDKAKALVEAMKKAGVADKDIKTTSYNVFPEYNYEAPAPRISGYRVSTAYEVSVRDFDKINEVISQATSSGANVVSNIAFDINEETKKSRLNEAREEAVKEAREKAEGLAKASGVRLGKILNISESQYSQPPTPIALKEAGGGIGGAEPSQPSISPGETELSVSVSISFEIQ